jgi:sphingomyelin phosphodiesterase acid-like 3
LQGPFFNDIAILFSSLVHNKNIQGEMQKQIARAGYYAIDLPQQPNLRLIVLNTNLFSVKAKGKGLERAAFQELDWLHQELVSVKNRQQKALIAMHIPQGINLYTSLNVRLFTLLALWHPAYNKRFDAELKAFAPEISGIFTAHLHSDSVEILNYGEGRNIPVLGTPSISPLFGNHPGFKIYSYLAATLEMEEYFTYFYPLNARRAWGLEYDLNRIYQPNCYSCPISEGLTPYGDGVFAITFKDQLDAAAKWYVYYGCAIWQLSTKNYEFCKQF